MKTYTIRNQDGQIKQVTEDQLADYGLEIPKAKKGGMIKRADGSYSRPGLWDNIRKNKGSGKKPTKAMLEQERKIRAAEKAYGGYMAYGGMYDMGGLYPMGGYVPMAQDGMEQSVPMVEPSMLQPVDQTQLPLRPGVAEQVPYTIRGEYSAKEVPTKKSTGPNKYSVVDYMISMGLDPSKESRKAFAKKLGIKDYDFSAAKNTELLKLLKSNNKVNTKIAEHQQYTFPESLSSDVMSSPVAPVLSKTSSSAPFVGGHAEVPYDETSYTPAKATAKSSQKVDNEYSQLSDWDLYKENSGTFRYFFNPDFRMNVDKTNKLDAELARRGYKDWDDIRKAEEKKGRFKSPYSKQSYPEIKYSKPAKKEAPLPQINNYFGRAFGYGGGINNPGFRALPEYVQEKIKANMATGGCMECGGKMQNGGTPFQNYLQKYPSRPATDTLVGTPFYGDTPASEQLRVNDLLKARQQTPNLGNRWNTEEKMNPSIYDWDPASYPNITPANKPFKPVMQKGGKTFADIERERANMYKQMTTPIGASKYTDYPPTYTVSPTPKQKGKAKPVYPVIQPKKYIPLPASAIQDVNIEYPYGQEMPPQPFNYPVGRYLPGSYVQSPEYAEGGKLPAELLRARLEAHMSPSEAQDYLNKYQNGGKERFPEEVKIHASNPNLMSDAYLRGVFEQSINPRWDSATRAEASKDYDNMLKAREYVKYLDSLNMENRLQEIKKLKQSPSFLDNIWGYTKDFLKFEEGGQLDEAGDGKWIQKAINPAHKGYCTPMTKATCTPRRKALARTLKKMAKSRKADGGYIQGQQYEMDDNQIAKLRAMGYKIKEV